MCKFCEKGKWFILIQKIYCDAKDCIHNIGGPCASGVVDVKAYVGPEDTHAYCDSYAMSDSITANLSSEMTASSTTAQTLANNVGVTQENTNVLSDIVGCTATDCAYNTNAMCAATAVHIESPQDAGDTMSLCGTYKKEER